MLTQRLSLAGVTILFVIALGLYSVEHNQVAPPPAKQTTSTTPTLILSAPAGPLPPDAPIDVQLTITGTTNLGGFEFDLVYDPSLVTLTDMSLSSFMGETTNCDPNTSRCVAQLGPLDQNTAVSLGAYSFGTGVGPNGDGLLATLHFTPTGQTGVTGLYLTNALLTDIDGSAITPTVIDTSLEIAVPISGLTAVSDSPTPLGAFTALTATVAGGSDVLYTWDLGDGTFDYGPIVTHTYTSTGAYTAVITAANSANLITATTAVIVDEMISGLTAVNNSPTPLGASVTLTAAVASGSNVTYTWDLGDGAIAYGPVVTHNFSVGRFTAVITASNAVSAITATTPITVDETIAALTAANDSPTPLGASTVLSAAVSAGSNVTYTWNLGDGTTGVGQIVTHTYAVGTYTAVVTAANSVSQMTAITPIIVDELITGLQVSNSSPTVLGNQTILTATVASGSRVSYTWNLGNGVFATGPVVTYTYPTTGTFTAVVTATNAVNQLAASTPIIVDVAINLLLAGNNGPTPLGDSTTLWATVPVELVTTFQWDFGDGVTGFGPVVTHTYPATGTFTAVVTATNAVSQLMTSTPITVDETIAGLQALNNSPTLSGQPTTLTAAVAAGSHVNYLWDFGDGETGAGQVVTHTYGIGAYTAVVTAVNSVSQLSANTSIVVDEAITLLQIVADGAVVLGQPITFTAAVGAGSGVGYEWDFGDSADGSGPMTTHTYTRTGVYTAVVTATNSVSQQTANTIVTVTGTANPTIYLPIILKPGGGQSNFLPGKGRFQAGKLAHAQTMTGTLAINPDIDGDGFVTVIDIELVAAAWGTDDTDPNWDPALDLNADAQVDEADITLVVARWRRGMPTLLRTSPMNGESLVSVTRETILEFTDPVDPATVLSNTVTAQFGGQVLSATMRLSPDGRRLTLFYNPDLPNAARVRVTVNGDNLLSAAGYVMDVDGDGLPGGQTLIDFDTVSLSRIPNTDVWGYVYDSYNTDSNGNDIPVEGATIRVDGVPGLQAVTDASGYFILQDVPAPVFFVHIDGSTAVNPPPNTMYATVGKAFHSVPGHSVQLFMDGVPFDIYLPPMDLGDIQPLSPITDTDIGFGSAGLAELQQMFPNMDPAVWLSTTVTFPPNSAVDKQGNPAVEAAIIPVPSDRLPAPLPPHMNHQLDIAVIAPGATNFDEPAPACFPNLPDPDTGELLPPGTKSALISFNHDTGQWEMVGSMTVDAIAQYTCTDSGVGIPAPGWHGSSPVSSASGGCTDCCNGSPPTTPEPPGWAQSFACVLARPSYCEAKFGSPCRASCSVCIGGPGGVNAQGLASCISRCMQDQNRCMGSSKCPFP